jgi:hypothetical protein
MVCASPPTVKIHAPGRLSIVESRRNTEPTHLASIIRSQHSNPCQPKKGLSHHSRKRLAQWQALDEPAAQQQSAPNKHWVSLSLSGALTTDLHCNPWICLFCPPSNNCNPHGPPPSCKQLSATNYPNLAGATKRLFVGSSQGLHHPGPSPGSCTQASETGAFEGGAATCKSVSIYPFPSH